MCSADIAAIGWPKEAIDGSDGTKVIPGQRSVAHTCRNYDRIRDWAKERQIHLGAHLDIIPAEEGMVIPEYQ